MRTARLVLVALLAFGCGGDDDGSRPDGAAGQPDSGGPGGPDGATGQPDAGGNPVNCVPVEGRPQLQRVVVAEGFDRPIYVTSPPNDARLFVVEQNGSIRVIKDGAVLNDDFLFVEQTQNNLSGGDERGLLGLAFDPEYASTGLFYVFYMDDATGDHVVDEYQVGAGNPDAADPNSRVEVIRIDDQAGNHNGGMLAFGPNDGYLYISVGDGGPQGDPEDDAEEGDNLLGKILRVDVSSLPYVIPTDNPFVDDPSFRDEIFAYGFRNPWRFSFDRETGDIYVGDVGQNEWEEVTARPASASGEDYGWNMFEGTHCYDNTPACDMTGKVPPVYEWSHGDGCTAVGGFVYRGCVMPGYHGTYFFADYCSGWVRSFEWDGAGGYTNFTEWDDLGGGTITAFGEDANGEIYITGFAGGRVYRIQPQ